MNGAFYIGAVGLDAQQRALDVVANNIANLNTTAFKRSAVQFSDLVAPVRDGADQPMAAPDPIAGLTGAVADTATRIWTMGPLRQTGQPLDVAINGDGFIELLGPAGRSLLWRGGTLEVNSDGALATSDGTPLRAAISVPQSATSLTIAQDGTVSAMVGGTSQKLGQIELAMVKSPNELVDDGNGYYETTDSSSVTSVQAGQDGSGLFVQGSLESLNVQLSDEMTSLLLIQRAYAANAEVVQAGDQLMSIVNGLRH